MRGLRLLFLSVVIGLLFVDGGVAFGANSDIRSASIGYVTDRAKFASVINAGAATAFHIRRASDYSHALPRKCETTRNDEILACGDDRFVRFDCSFFNVDRRLPASTPCTSTESSCITPTSIDALGSGYRSIAYSRRYNYPNHNPLPALRNHSFDVEAEDLRALIERLGIQPVNVVGVSYGGLTALSLAMKHPEMVRSLVVVEPPLFSWLPDLPGGKALLDDFNSRLMTPSAGSVSSGQTRRRAACRHQLLRRIGRRVRSHPVGVPGHAARKHRRVGGGHDIE